MINAATLSRNKRVAKKEMFMPYRKRFVKGVDAPSTASQPFANIDVGSLAALFASISNAGQMGSKRSPALDRIRHSTDGLTAVFIQSFLERLVDAQGDKSDFVAKNLFTPFIRLTRDAYAPVTMRLDSQKRDEAAALEAITTVDSFFSGAQMTLFMRGTIGVLSYSDILYHMITTPGVGGMLLQAAVEADYGDMYARERYRCFARVVLCMLRSVAIPFTGGDASKLVAATLESIGEALNGTAHIINFDYHIYSQMPSGGVSLSSPDNLKSDKPWEKWLFSAPTTLEGKTVAVNKQVKPFGTLLMPAEPAVFVESATRIMGQRNQNVSDLLSDIERSNAIMTNRLEGSMRSVTGYVASIF
jgi:hypothetical protein